MARSPQTSIRMVPAVVVKVTPFESRWNALAVNCDGFAAHAAELAITMSRTKNLLLSSVSRIGMLSPRVQRCAPLSQFPRLANRTSIETRCRYRPAALRRLPWSALLFATDLTLQTLSLRNPDLRPSNKGGRSENADGHPCRLQAPSLTR